MVGNVKIITFVPEKYTEKVFQAMGDAGAGNIGNYKYCGFVVKGLGRFTPEEGAHPFIGKIGKPDEVIEDKIEMICPQKKSKDVVAAIRKAHPYEEPAIDIYKLVDEDQL